MTGGGEGRHRIKLEQVCIGLHIKLDSWLGHPFLLSSFKISNEQQIAILRSMGLTEVEYLPARSDTKPLPSAAGTQPSATSELPVTDDAVELEELMREKRARIETLNRERNRVRAAERKFLKAANDVKNVARLVNNNPQGAAALSGQIAGELAELFVSEQSNYIHLMGENVTDDSAYFHSLNVTVLSLILASALGVGEAEALRDIAQGAVLHDAGKISLPGKLLLMDEAEMTKAETNLMRLHPAYGVKLMQSVQTLPAVVRQIILFHHETADGSGYPNGIKADTLDQAVRIVSIANDYDNLCNQYVVRRSKTPAEALSHMYKEVVKYDKAALSAFIRVLGVYPPGTIVKLRSGKVGIVMSVESDDILHPNLMIYDPDIPSDKAAIVNLKRDLEDMIDRTLRPAALPEPIHEYLSPRKRICYFVDHAGNI